MNIKSVAYWLATVLFLFPLAASGVGYLTGADTFIESMAHLGYPASLLPFLGVAKVLGVVAVLAPGFAKLKEWAYAGFTFNLLGASWAHYAVGDGAETVIPLVFLALLAVSYTLRPEGRRLEVHDGQLVPAK